MKSLWKKLSEGFQKTRSVMTERIQEVLQPQRRIDPELYVELEAVLLSGDVGPTTTTVLLDRLRERAGRDRIEDAGGLRDALRAIVEELLRESASGSAGSLDVFRPASPIPSASTSMSSAASEPGQAGPRVILVVGVNGVGKTTSLAKLAFRAKAEGKIPLIVASDTFRAAASEQLEVWAKRLDVQIVRSRTGADPGAVAFDGIEAARARGAQVVLIDTAGRLQTKGNLMEELRKIHRVVGKALPGAPHETILVLDATLGQNALSQARIFSEAAPVTGLLLAKLDGTSKGGVILAIAHELKIPVRYVGVGEQAEDLLDFDPALFAEGLVGEVREEVVP